MLALEAIGSIAPEFARGELVWLPAWQPPIGELAATFALAALAAAIGTVIRMLATAERRAAAELAS